MRKMLGWVEKRDLISKTSSSQTTSPGSQSIRVRATFFIYVDDEGASRGWHAAGAIGHDGGRLMEAAFTDEAFQSHRLEWPGSSVNPLHAWPWKLDTNCFMWGAAPTPQHSLLWSLGHPGVKVRIWSSVIYHCTAAVNVAVTSLIWFPVIFIFWFICV